MTSCVSFSLEYQCEDFELFEVECILQMQSVLLDRIDLVDDLLNHIYGTSLFCHPCLEDFHSSWTCASLFGESECVEMKSVSSTYSEFHEVMKIDHDA